LLMYAINKFAFESTYKTTIKTLNN
jgi:hypothetical protein